ncbi:tryptorubin family RiPP precursor [Embleya sp. NBC_00888]|uniref:tryptorubin family RiPP precursor n=1 Tax=Embleya sp. NBC_00888 TaxID=2975960 RepID=UPI0038690CE9
MGKSNSPAMDYRPGPPESRMRLGRFTSHPEVVVMKIVNSFSKRFRTEKSLKSATWFIWYS